MNIHIISRAGFLLTACMTQYCNAFVNCRFPRTSQLLGYFWLRYFIDGLSIRNKSSPVWSYTEQRNCRLTWLFPKLGYLETLLLGHNVSSRACVVFTIIINKSSFFPLIPNPIINSWLLASGEGLADPGAGDSLGELLGLLFLNRTS